jgi:chemotaxis protein histidine kinase CheA
MALRALNRPVIQKTEEHGSFQIIHPRNALKAKAAFYSDTNKPVDEEAIMAAEAAIEALAPQFFFWLDESVTKLITTRDAMWQSEASPEATDEFYRAAHDIRGTGTTFGFPLASRVADSLVYLVEKIGVTTTPRALIDKHVDAIRAIVKEDAREDNQLGSTLVQQLAAVTNRYIEMHSDRQAALA